MAGKEKRLRNLLNLYLRYPIIAGIVFAVMNIMVYFISVRAGIVVSIAVLAYFVWLLFMIFNKHVAVSKALMDFASGYAQMQKRFHTDFWIIRAKYSGLIILLVQLLARTTTGRT